MAIPIIGAAPSTSRAASPLPTAELDLPPPGTAPAGKPVLARAQLEPLLLHAEPLVRAFAVEQCVARGAEMAPALVALATDADDYVAKEAIAALELLEHSAGVPAILERFKHASGETAAAAARALGELAPERLLQAMQERGRLDDEAYAATATALANAGGAEVQGYLDRAINRSGALAAERRVALFAAALMSGSRALALRVVGQALADSQRDEPEGGSFPARTAITALAGLTVAWSVSKRGVELFDLVRDGVEKDLLPLLPPGGRQALAEASAKKQVRALISALEPVLSLAEAPATGEVEDSALRRRVILEALLERKEEIGKLALDRAAAFVALAVQSAVVLLAGAASEATSPALQALARALEQPGLDAARVAAMTPEELRALFAEKTERQMRRVVSILAREAVHRAQTRADLARAVLQAGHGVALLEAASEVEQQDLAEALVTVAEERTVDLEPLVLEALQRTPLDPKLARLGLVLSNHCRTERVALAIARRFYELRQAARRELVTAAVHNGDARLIPLLATRSFAHEPEEVAFTVLSLAHRQESDQARAALARTKDPGREDELPLVLPLVCQRCHEELIYRLHRAFIDTEAKDRLGDPALVGDTRCRACGADDQLAPTDLATQILTSHMVEFLRAVERGAASGPPLVAPGQTELYGRKLGLSEALRKANEEVERSPQSIRARLVRSRLHLVLRRQRRPEDLEAVRALDPRSPEADALEAAHLSAAGETTRALELAARAVRELRADPPPRLYDADDLEQFRATVENYLYTLHTASGLALPGDLDLGEAQKRLAAREPQPPSAAPSALSEEEEEEALRAAPRALTEADLRNVGRNDPCPCGSGQKFKRCHGRGR